MRTLVSRKPTIVVDDMCTVPRVGDIVVVVLANEGDECFGPFEVADNCTILRNATEKIRKFTHLL